MEIVLRAEHPGIHYCGDFYGQSDKGYPYPQGISVDSLLNLLRKVGSSFTEMACHPGDGIDANSSYCEERGAECRTLCDHKVRETVREENIVLCSFSQLLCQGPAVLMR